MSRIITLRCCLVTTYVTCDQVLTLPLQVIFILCIHKVILRGFQQDLQFFIFFCRWTYHKWYDHFLQNKIYSQMERVTETKCTKRMQYFADSWTCYLSGTESIKSQFEFFCPWKICFLFGRHLLLCISSSMLNISILCLVHHKQFTIADVSFEFVYLDASVWHSTHLFTYIRRKQVVM